MSDFGLGLKPNLLRSSTRDFVFPALSIHEKKLGLWEQWPALNRIGLGPFAGLLLRSFSSKARLFNTWYQTLLEEAVTINTPNSQGIFGPAIQSGQGLLDKPGHNQIQMLAEGSFSIFSSADGYGMMLSGFQHYLCHYPHVYKKLAVEIRGRFKTGEKIKWGPELESMTYLRAVLDEVMRMLPPACGVHWRECESADVTVGEDDLPLPVGSDIGMSLFALFKNGRIFRDPAKFWPERWIPGTLPEAEFSFAKKMFTPFSVGPRNCAGSHVAIMMASISFTYLLANYDFRLGPNQPKSSPHLWSNTPLEPGSEAELLFESHFTIAGWKSGPFVQFKERKQLY